MFLFWPFHAQFCFYDIISVILFLRIHSSIRFTFLFDRVRLTSFVDCLNSKAIVITTSTGTSLTTKGLGHNVSI